MWWKREDEGSSSVVNCVWLLPKMTYKYVSWTSYTSAISQKQVLMVNAFILSSTHFSLKKKFPINVLVARRQTTYSQKTDNCRTDS